VGWYQKGKTNLDFTEARDSEWQCHQLGHMQVCKSLQTDNHASTSPLSFYRPDAFPVAILPPNQQHQCTKGKSTEGKLCPIQPGLKPIHSFYGPPESVLQTAARSLQPFLYGSQL